MKKVIMESLIFIYCITFPHMWSKCFEIHYNHDRKRITPTFILSQLSRNNDKNVNNITPRKYTARLLVMRSENSILISFTMWFQIPKRNLPRWAGKFVLMPIPIMLCRYPCRSFEPGTSRYNRKVLTTRTPIPLWWWYHMKRISSKKKNTCPASNYYHTD